jgi:hypothetical protein
MAAGARRLCHRHQPSDINHSRVGAVAFMEPDGSGGHPTNVQF